MTKVDIESLLGEYMVEMPGNGISEVGIEEIQQYLRNWGLQSIPDTINLPDGTQIDWRWDWKVGGRGEYVGTLPKRIAKYLWQAHRSKLSGGELSKIGDIGAAHSGRHAIFHFDIVDEIDWEQTDFGQPESCCFWSCHANAKKMIADNGGGAIRFYHDDSYSIDEGFARAWLAPWQDCWVVFNGYGLEALAIARILAAHLGHTYYHRIGLMNFGRPDGSLWINATNGRTGSGFLVGPQDTVLKYCSIDLRWKEIGKVCSSCEESFDGDSYTGPDDILLCEGCFHEEYFRCEECDEVGLRDDVCMAENGSYCETCFHNYYICCKECGEPVRRSDAIRMIGGREFCSECARKMKETERAECAVS